MRSLHILFFFCGVFLSWAAPVHPNETESHQAQIRSDLKSKDDFIHTWTPSVAVTVLDNVVYSKSTNSAEDIYRKLGQQLGPVMKTDYWKDHGAGKSFGAIKDALPTVSEGVVKAAMV